MGIKQENESIDIENEEVDQYNKGVDEESKLWDELIDRELEASQKRIEIFNRMKSLRNN
ncbi:MAG: hypothetical protein AB1611_05680 [bacterium]